MILKRNATDTVLKAQTDHRKVVIPKRNATYTVLKAQDRPQQKDCDSQKNATDTVLKAQHQLGYGCNAFESL